MRFFFERIPYDWKNPINYFATAIYQYISMQRLCNLAGLGATFGIGGLLFGIAIIRDLKIVLKSINDSAIDGERSKLEALKRLNEFIELHSMVKE